METKNLLFENGSLWLKADFHLHTKADKEFSYEQEDNDFCRLYVDQLKQQNIGIGIITNHNKFDKKEFVALQKKAKSKNIWLLPGVELSIKDGANGIHCLIAFEYQAWIKNNDNFIEKFLQVAFENHENGNTQCKYNLDALCEKLEGYRRASRDSFITMAHIEQKSGFSKELKGGRIQSFTKQELFKSNVLAFQKLRSNKVKENLITWFNGEEQLPAFVEGSDCKNLKQVGDCGQQTDEHGNKVTKSVWVKIGDHNFEALKYALIDKENRITLQKKPQIKNSYIKSIAFEGGLLDQTKIGFSPELNNFIGIRGSGKSSILEILRYTLGISLGEQSNDKSYKNDLIEYVLGSGGKTIITAIDKNKKEYCIHKIYGEKEEIYEGNTRLDISSIDTIFKQPVYFGQKDLSNKHIDFEADLVKKLIGDKLDDIKERINKRSSEVRILISDLKKLEDLVEKKEEIQAKIKDAKHKLKIYKDKGIEKKLKRQSIFDAEIEYFENVNENIEKFQNKLKGIYDDYQEFFTNSQFISEENKEAFEQANEIYKNIYKEFKKLSNIHDNITKEQKDFENLHKKLLEKKEKLKEEFAKIKRTIAIPDLNPDDFLKIKRIIKTSKVQLTEIERSEKQRSNLEKSLHDSLAELNDLWHQEFKILKKEVKRINNYENSLSIEVAYKGRKDNFKNKLEEMCKGSGIRKNSYDTITEQYKDFIAIYKDFVILSEKTKLSENHTVTFKNNFNEKLEDLLTYRVPDKFTIQYNQKPLNQHSLGQRATALILFLLAQEETDVLIIDQPEDDLDNQTIYEDVIKSIKKLKGNMQFIFATHNPNIPVLGDSEKVISCEYLNSATKPKIKITGGTIDSPGIQKKIVTIMEGGEEAFRRRKTIYENWDTMKGK